MSALFGSVAAYTVLLALLVAAAEHLTAPARLHRALAAHRVLPAPAVFAAAVTASEILLGGVGAVVLLREGPGRVLVATLLGSALLFSGYGGYSYHVWSNRRPGSCGCSQLATPTTGWVVARAFLLAGAALTAAALSASVIPFARSGAELTVALLAAAAFTSLLWALPAAMWEPQRSGGGR